MRHVDVLHEILFLIIGVYFENDWDFVYFFAYNFVTDRQKKNGLLRALLKFPVTFSIGMDGGPEKMDVFGRNLHRRWYSSSAARRS